jgi:multicomponent Na+:H+ antiporter subunit E
MTTKRSLTPSPLLAFTAVWLILAGLDPGAWVIGVPTIVLATWASVRLRPPPVAGRLSALAALRFAPYFLWQSLRGGLDVAWRVLRLRPRVTPGTRSYPLRIASPAGQVLFINTLSLLPGSLGADIQGDRLTVHALDVSDLQTLDREIEQLEVRIARLFGERLASEEPRGRTGEAAAHERD